MSVKEKDGVLEVLTGEGVNSDNKIVKWATYATAAITVGAIGYAIYKGISNANKISDINNRLSELELKGAPNTQDVVDL